MFSKVITFIVLLMIASSAYSFKSHLDRFIHGKSLEVSLICLWFSSLILTNFSLGDHDHTYLHNPSNGSCFEEEVLKKGPKNCQPDPRFSREKNWKNSMFIFNFINEWKFNENNFFQVKSWFNKNKFKYEFATIRASILSIKCYSIS